MLEAAVLARLTRTMTLAGHKSEAVVLIPRGVELAQRTEAFGALSLLHGTEMMLAPYDPKFDAAFERAVEAARNAHDLGIEQNLFTNVGFVSLWCGDFGRSREWLRRAAELDEQLSRHESYSKAGYSWLLSLLGEYDEGRELADAASRSPGVPTRIVALTARYEIAERQEDPCAEAVVAELLSLAAHTGEAQRSVPALSARARHELLHGDLVGAIPLFWEALEVTRGDGSSGSHWLFSPDLARALSEGGRVDDLAKWYEAVAALSVVDPNLHNQAAGSLVRAYLSAARGDAFSARRELEEAVARFAAMPCPARETEALIALAGLEWEEGRSDAAGDAARRALILAQRRGARALERLAMDAVRRSESRPVFATILFTDIVGSTEQLSTLGDRAWSAVIERHHAIVRHELERFGGREIDTAGDGFLAAFDAPARGIRCAFTVRSSLAAAGIIVRAALHTGECQLVSGKLVGLAVHIASRVCGAAGPGEVLVTGTVRELVAGSGIGFDARGTHQLKGVPGEWSVFSVVMSV